MIGTEDNWSGSETESLSEIDLDRQDDSLSTLFDCAEHKSTDHYLTKNNLKRFMEFTDTIKTSEDMNIFGLTCNLSTIYDPKVRRHLFQLVKSQLYELLNCSSSQIFSYKGSSGLNIKNLRKHLANFIMLLLPTFKLLKNNLNDEVISDIVKDLISILKSVGCIHHHPQWTDIEDNHTINYHLFHLRLELKVHIFMLLSTLPLNTNSMMFNQVAISLIMDLLTVSKMMFDKIKRKGIGVWTKDAFLCPCCKHVWVVVIHVLKNVEVNNSTFEPFWSIVSQCLNDENDTRNSLINRSNFQCCCSGVSKMWIMSSIASLHWIDVVGNDMYNNKMVVPGDWVTVQEILRKELTKDLCDETVISLVWGCTKLSRDWMPNLEVFNLLLDYFNKNMNDSPRGIPTAGITGYMQKNLDPSSQLDRVLSLLVVNDIIDPEDLPYDIFLRYIVLFVQRLKCIESQQALSQVKKRIYNKFHKRRLMELNQYGLHRFTTLFITLAMTLEDIDIIPKMITLLATRTFTNNTTGGANHKQQASSQIIGCRNQVIYCNFMVLHLCAKQGTSKNDSMNNVVNCIVQRFHEAAEQLVTNRRNKELFQVNMDFIQYILKCIERFFEDIKRKEEGLALICPAYRQLLRYAADFQNNSILLLHVNRLVSLFANDDGFSKDSRSKALSLFNELFYDPLEQIYSSAPNEKVTDVFASLTVLSIECNASLTQRFLQKHGFDDDKKLIHRSFYLRKILNSSTVIEFLEYNNYVPSCIKNWLSCCVWHPDDAVLFTRNIVQLPTVSKYVLNMQQCEEFNDVIVIACQFISGVGKYYNQLEMVAEMGTIRKFLEIAFSGFVKDADQALVTNSNSSAVRTAFELSGKLVKHCAKAIYSKTSPICLLPQLIDLFVLPLKSSKKSPLPDYSKISTRYLHYFLQGMSWLDLKRDDFVIRKMKDITQKYFVECCIASYKDPEEKNPFLISLLPSCSETPKKHSSDYRMFLLGHITENYLIFPQNPQRLACILNLLVQVVTATKSHRELFETIKLLLNKLLTCILICDAARSKGEPVAVKNLAVRVLKFARNLELESHNLICDIVKNFVKEHFQNYQATVLKTLQTVYITCPAVVKRILEEVDEIVHENEKIRGAGIDTDLRASLRDLHALIEAGTNENRR